MAPSRQASWAILGACLTVALVGVGWLSVSAQRLHRIEQRARADAALQENARLSLWRMDLAVTAMLEREAARPTWDDAHPGGREPFELLRFELSPGGQYASKAVSPGEDQLGKLVSQLTWENLERVSHRPALVTAALRQPSNPVAIQQQRNAIEFNARNRYVQQLPSQALAPTSLNASASPAGRETEPQPRMGPITAVWLGERSDTLALIRRVQVDGLESIEGCILDWPRIRKWLLEEIKDLLPAAQLEPRTSAGRGDEYLLAALPLRLIPGRLANPPEASAQFLPALLAAWFGIFVAASAVVTLFLGALALSERRAAFVSAVTHELRTPLTTFRMYTEMLAQGMVSKDQHAEYLETLHREANRLGHLVENVLAYARLQRGPRARKLERVDLAALLAREERRLSEHAAKAGMKIIIEQAATDAVSALGDSMAIEQVLFNLVDNACKYARSAADPRIHLLACRGTRHVELRVKDHGPGIPRERARRMFEPFSKSSQDAASSAPGVGLGLALSRRLARAMRGDLTLEPTKDGACFVLALLPA